VKHKGDLTEVVRARVSERLKKQVLSTAGRNGETEADVVRCALDRFLDDPSAIATTKNRRANPKKFEIATA